MSRQDDFGEEIHTERRERKLTDADVEAICDEFEDRMKRRLYMNVGRGVLGWLWDKLIVIIILAILFFYMHGTESPVQQQLARITH